MSRTRARPVALPAGERSVAMARRPMRISGDGSDYVGKRLLVGITYEDHTGQMIRQEQFLGIILEAGETEIVVERNDTRERMSLPPELVPAGRGQYRLRSTGARRSNHGWVC